MKKHKKTIYVVIGSFAFFAVLTFVTYVEQNAINKEQAKYESQKQ